MKVRFIPNNSKNTIDLEVSSERVLSYPPIGAMLPEGCRGSGWTRPKDHVGGTRGRDAVCGVGQGPGHSEDDGAARGSVPDGGRACEPWAGGLRATGTQAPT